MKEFIINENDAGQRIDKFLQKAVKKLPASLMYKYFRLKRIKINGKAAKQDSKLNLNDILQLYINDEFFEKEEKQDEFLSLNAKIDVVYEDENIMLVNKPFGLIVHSDDNETRNTLINHVKAYLYDKGEFDPVKENSFAPALCNRLDRNTGGIVIVAKNAESLRQLNDDIKDKTLGKFYLLRILGEMKPKNGELRSYLLKDSKTNTVRSVKTLSGGAKTAITLYKTVKTLKDGTSIVEAELKTGRTHQIRVQFADSGHPLLGDGKYGKNEINKRFGFKYQALFSYKLVFPVDMSGSLEYLAGKEFFANPPEWLK